MRRTTLGILALEVVLSLIGITRAADSEMDRLKQRFAQRYPQLRQLKSEGKIGETFQGYVDFVKGRDDGAGKLVDEENADRRALYKLIADKEKTTPEKVAERNAQRNFEKAQSGDWLKGADGSWKQKK